MPFFHGNTSQNSFALVAGDDLDKCSLELHGSRRHLPGGDVSVPGPRGFGGLVEALATDLKIVLNRRVRFCGQLNKVTVEVVDDSVSVVSATRPEGFIICFLKVPLFAWTARHLQNSPVARKLSENIL